MLSTVSVVTFHMPVTLSSAASPTPTSTLARAEAEADQQPLGLRSS